MLIYSITHLLHCRRPKSALIFRRCLPTRPSHIAVAAFPHATPRLLSPSLLPQLHGLRRGLGETGRPCDGDCERATVRFLAAYEATGPGRGRGRGRLWPWRRRGEGNTEGAMGAVVCCRSSTAVATAAEQALARPYHAAAGRWATKEAGMGNGWGTGGRGTWSAGRVLV